MPRLTPTERAYAEGYRSGQLDMRRRVWREFAGDFMVKLGWESQRAWASWVPVKAPKRKRRAK